MSGKAARYQFRAAESMKSGVAGTPACHAIWGEHGAISRPLASPPRFGMAAYMEGEEPPSPIVPDLDGLKGADHATATPAGGRRKHALTAEWSHETAGNRMDFLIDGPDRLEALIAAINGARTSLKLLYYMFSDDVSGNQVMDALIAALGRGVKVSLIIDGFGSGDTAARFFTRFAEAGGDYHAFSTKWRATYLIRNHQKLLIADDALVITGGFNISDDYFGSIDNIHCWHDLGLRLTGPAVAPMVEYFAAIEGWVNAPGHNWKSLRFLIHTWDRINPRAARQRMAYSSESRQSGPLHWYIGGPTRRFNPWVKAIKADLDAGQRLHMIEAYFAPGQGMLRRIARIATERKGATVILPSKSDNGATIGAARILYGYLLKRGVRIYEFAPTKLHMKLIVIDNITWIGTANFDMRSLFINMELMLRIDDPALAEEMRNLVDIHADHSDVITRLEHKRQLTPMNRLRWSLAYFIVAVMDYGVTRRLNFGIGG